MSEKDQNKRFRIKHGYLIFEGDHPETNEEAFEITREKWQTIIGVFLEPGTVKDGGDSTCGLCMLYFDDGCRDCPVFAYTGNSMCESTPYPEYCEAEPENGLNLASDILAYIGMLETWWIIRQETEKKEQ